MKNHPLFKAFISLPRSPFFLEDAYKLSHIDQIPDEVTHVYANTTPRKSRIHDIDAVIVFGIQPFLYKLDAVFNHLFFGLPKEEALDNFKKDYLEFFLTEPRAQVVDKIAALWELGKLPIKIKALPEGTSCPIGVPFQTIVNTEPGFGWLSLHIESWASCEIWHPITSATIARHYRQIFDHYVQQTSDLEFLTPFLGHDFSFRGQSGLSSAQSSGAAHLIYFKGTDTCPSLSWIKDNYGFDFDKDLLATSVPATEHSIAQMSGPLGEEEYLNHILNLYPSGIVSVVADTYDFWSFVTDIVASKKDQIMARDGKLVLRPDSSPKTPVEIIIGDPEAPEGSPENKGLIQVLYEIFGGTKNSKGYIELDSHIGAIYGDSITPEYQKAILAGLMKKGFSGTSMVFGIGSFTYQYVTRDTFGMAFKETAVCKAEEGWVATYKDPKTDISGKRSAKGLLKVVPDEEKGLALIQGVTIEEENTGLLREVYNEGIVDSALTSFNKIRERAL